MLKAFKSQQFVKGQSRNAAGTRVSRTSRRCSRVRSASPSAVSSTSAPFTTDSSTLSGLQRGDSYDLVLSSGFLAFANHSGFLKAVDDAGLQVAGIMGTSAGALAGSLYAAGYPPDEVAGHLMRDPPISLLCPSLEPWKGGVLSLDKVVKRLYELLPPTFEDLDREFAVGVVTQDGEHVLIDSGPLPEAVAASAAIPFIFSGVEIPGHRSSMPMKDGGVVDRIGLKAWRDRRRRQLMSSSASSSGQLDDDAVRPPPAICHIISKSSPWSGFDDAHATGEPEIFIVRSPKSGVNFFDLGDVDRHMQEAYERARPVTEHVKMLSIVQQGKRYAF